MPGVFEAEWLMLIKGNAVPLAIGGQIIEGTIRTGEVARIPVGGTVRRRIITGIEMADSLSEGRYWTVLRFQCDMAEFDRDWRGIDLKGVTIQINSSEAAGISHG